MVVPVKKLEELDDWSEALDYQVDMHIQLSKTKDPVKRLKLIAQYKKAERVAARLARKPCARE